MPLPIEKHPPNLDGLEVRDLAPTEAEAWVRFFAGGSAPSAAEMARFRWQYLDLPEDHLWIKVAEPTDPSARTADIFAASYCMAPRRFTVDGEPLQGALSLDTMTGENYRKRGLFVHLAIEAYRTATEQGLQFVYGSPNDNSLPGFLKYLGWVKLPEPPVLATARPLRWGLGRLGLGRSRRNRRIEQGPEGARTVEIGATDHIGERFDELWNLAKGQLRIAAVRDAAFWKWRYLQPSAQARIFAVTDDRGALIGAIGTCKVDKREGTRGFIMDALFAPGWPGVPRWALRRVCAELAADGCRAIVAVVTPGNPWGDAYRSARFFAIPDRYRPTFRLAVASFRERADALVSRPADWYLTYADSDVL